MKTFKGLYIDNGVIKAGEFPVEPKKWESGDSLSYNEAEWQCYKEALASAKANAVECEDQEEAKEIIAYELFNGPVVDVPLSRFNEKIIPFPSGWDYRVEECKIGRSVKDKDSIAYGYETYTEQVAKLYRVEEQKKPHGFCETPNSTCTMNYCDENGCNERKRTLAEPEESQDKLWMNVIILVGQNIDRQGSSKIIQQLEERFTITQRK